MGAEKSRRSSAVSVTRYFRAVLLKRLSHQENKFRRSTQYKSGRLLGGQSREWDKRVHWDKRRGTKEYGGN